MYIQKIESSAIKIDEEKNEERPNKHEQEKYHSSIPPVEHHTDIA